MWLRCRPYYVLRISLGRSRCVQSRLRGAEGGTRPVLLVLASRPLHRKIDGTGTARRLLRQRFSSLSGARLFNAIDHDEWLPTTAMPRVCLPAPINFVGHRTLITLLHATSLGPKESCWCPLQCLISCGQKVHYACTRGFLLQGMVRGRRWLWHESCFINKLYRYKIILHGVS